MVGETSDLGSKTIVLGEKKQYCTLDGLLGPTGR